MPGQLHVVGLKELQRDLRAIDVDLLKELRKVNLKAAKTATDASKSEAQGFGRMQSKAAAGIKASAGQTSAAMVVDARSVPFSLGAFLGSKKYPQFPEWVGNSWEPGGPGGPYAIGAALRQVADELVDEYGNAVDRLMHTSKSVFGAGVQGEITQF